MIPRRQCYNEKPASVRHVAFKRDNAETSGLLPRNFLSLTQC